MLRHFTIAVAGALLLTATPHARDPRIVVAGKYVGVQTDDLRARGHIQLTIVNGTEAPLRQATLRLSSPVNGALGDGPIEFGDVAAAETAVKSSAIAVDRKFYESGEPLVVVLSYSDAGEVRELSVTVRRDANGGAQ